MNEIATGNYICEIREAKGWTQEKLASMIGVSVKTVSSWENGKSKIKHENMIKLSEALEVSILDIMEGKEVTGIKEEDKRIVDEQIKELIERVNDLDQITIHIESDGAETMELSVIAAVVAYLAIAIALCANDQRSIFLNILILLCFTLGIVILWIGYRIVKDRNEKIRKRKGS